MTGANSEKGHMTEIAKKDAPAKFEHTVEAMPRLAGGRQAAEAPVPGADEVAPEPGKADVRSMRVPKLDQQTVWRVIEILKSL
jgi:hypothetical protein